MAKDIRYKLGEKIRAYVDDTLAEEEVGTIVKMPTKREATYIGDRAPDFYYVVDFAAGQRKVAQGNIIEVVGCDKVKVIEVVLTAEPPANLVAELKALAKRFGAVEALSKRTAQGWQLGAAFEDFAKADQFAQFMETIGTGRWRAAGAGN